MLYKYCHDEKSKSQLIVTGFDKNSTLLNGDGVDFMGNVLIRSDHGNNGTSHAEAMDAIQ